MLTLAEELAILALNEKGRNKPGSRSALQCAMTGGLLIDLAIQGRLSINSRRRVAIENSDPTDNVLLDQALVRIRKTRFPKPVLKWIIELTVVKSNVIDNLLYKNLFTNKYLKKTIVPCLRIFHKKIYKIADSKVTQEIHKRILSAVRSPEKTDIRTASLIGLIINCELSKDLLPDVAGNSVDSGWKLVHAMLAKQAKKEPILAIIISILEAEKIALQPIASM